MRPWALCAWIPKSREDQVGAGHGLGMIQLVPMETNMGIDGNIINIDVI